MSENSLVETQQVRFLRGQRSDSGILPLLAASMGYGSLGVKTALRSTKSESPSQAALASAVVSSRVARTEWSSSHAGCGPVYRWRMVASRKSNEETSLPSWSDSRSASAFGSKIRPFRP